MIVVDTNVMVRMVMGGPDGREASDVLRRDSVWFAPAILMSELRNALLGYVRRGTIALDRAREMSRDAALALDDRIVSIDSTLVLDVAMECDLTAYHAEFVVLARSLSVPLVTLDGGILDGAPDVAVRPRAFLDGP